MWWKIESSSKRKGFEHDLRRKGSKIWFGADWRQKYEDLVQKYVNPPFCCLLQRLGTWEDLVWF